MIQTAQPSVTDTVRSQTNDHSSSPPSASPPALAQERLYIPQDYVPGYTLNTQRQKTPPPPTMEELLTKAQEFTGTSYFPQLLPQDALPIDVCKAQLTEMLAEYKASVDTLSQPFSFYKHTLDKGQSQPQRWIWKERIPLSGLVLVNGAHGTGRTTFMHQLAAAVSSGTSLLGDKHQLAADVSSGTSLLDDTPIEQGGVVFVSCYTNVATAQRSHLAALGADLSRIRNISYIQVPAPEPHTGGFRPLSLPEDLPHLFRAIDQVKARLLILDDFMSLLSREQRWTNGRLGHLLTDLYQRMIERGVTCIIVRNCPARGSHTRPSLLERSDHFETIATSSLLLAPDPLQPNRILLSHADSSSSRLAPTLSLQIQPVPHASEHAQLTLLDSHTLTASDLMEHRPEALQRQLLTQQLLSFINRAPAPIPAPTLYARFPDSSRFQVHRALKDLLNIELIDRPSRGLYTPLNLPQDVEYAHELKSEQANGWSEAAHLPSPDALNGKALKTTETPPTNDLNLIKVADPLPTNGLNGHSATKAEMSLTNDLHLIQVADPLPKKDPNTIAPIPSHPEPLNELTEGTTTISTEEATSTITEGATTTPTEEDPPNLTEGATTNLTEEATTRPIEEATSTLTEGTATRSIEEDLPNLTGGATTIPTGEDPPNLTEGAATTPTGEETLNLTERAATISTEEPSNFTEGAVTIPIEEDPPNLTEGAATIPIEEAIKELDGTTTTRSNESLEGRPQEIAKILLDPSLPPRIREIIRTAHDSSLTHRLQDLARMLTDPLLSLDITQLLQYSIAGSKESLANRPQDITEILLDPALAARLQELIATAPHLLYLYRVSETTGILSDPFLRSDLRQLQQYPPPPR